MRLKFIGWENLEHQEEGHKKWRVQLLLVSKLSFQK